MCIPVRTPDSRWQVAGHDAAQSFLGTLWTLPGELGWEEEGQEASTLYVSFPGCSPLTTKVWVTLNHCQSIARSLPRSKRESYCRGPSTREIGGIWLSKTHQLTPRRSCEDPEGTALESSIWGCGGGSCDYLNARWNRSSIVSNTLRKGHVMAFKYRQRKKS